MSQIEQMRQKIFDAVAENWDRDQMWFEMHPHVVEDLMLEASKQSGLLPNLLTRPKSFEGVRIIEDVKFEGWQFGCGVRWQEIA